MPYKRGMCCYPIAKTVGILYFFPKSYKNTRTKKRRGKCLSSFWYTGREGLERAAQPKAGQKLRAGEQFLARGRVHGWMTADSMSVGIHPYLFTETQTSPFRRTSPYGRQQSLSQLRCQLPLHKGASPQ